MHRHRWMLVLVEAGSFFTWGTIKHLARRATETPSAFSTASFYMKNERCPIQAIGLGSAGLAAIENGYEFSENQSLSA